MNGCLTGSSSKVIRAHRSPPAVLLVACLIVLFTATRAALLLHPNNGPVTAADASAAFLIGLRFDLAAAVLICAPIFVLTFLAPNRMAMWRTWRASVLLTWGATLYGLTVVAIGEWLFWDEFSARYNFLAVD